MRHKKKRHRGLAIVIVFLIASAIANAQTSIKVSPEGITKRVKLGNFVDVPVKVTNDGKTPVTLKFIVEGDVAPFSTLDKTGASIDAGDSEDVKLTIFGENITILTGTFSVYGTVEDKVPINVTITDINAVPVEALLIEIEPITERAKIGDVFKYKIGLTNLISDRTYNVTLSHSIDRLEDQPTYKFDKSFFTETQVVELANSLSII